MRIFLALALLFAVPALVRAEPAASPEAGSAENEEPRRFDLLLYGGIFNDVTLGHILLNRETAYRPSYVWVAGLNYELGQFVGPITIETEGQVARHTGLQQNWEANALVIARREWVAPDSLSFSLAVGDGFSLASSGPRLEREENPRSNVLLQYLMFEFDVGLPFLPSKPRFMMRVHHRSGVFGVYCPETCGSNFITYGIKLAL